MEATLPLDQMSVAEKLRAMEILWADLSLHDHQIESPSWHSDILQAREASVRSGQEAAIDWEAAKKQLRERHG